MPRTRIRGASGAASMRYARSIMRRMRYAAKKKKTIKKLTTSYHFKRICDVANIQAEVAGAQNFGSYVFQLNQLPNFTEFTNLFDQYRINKVVLKLIPQFNQSTYNVGHPASTIPSGLPAGRNPRFYIVNDYDDDTNPASIDTLRQYAKVKVYPVMNNKIIKHIITPATQMQAYETLATTGYVPKFKQWINCNDNNVPHYAIKWGIENTSAIFSDPALRCTFFKVEATFYVSFKGVI